MDVPRSSTLVRPRPSFMRVTSASIWPLSVFRFSWFVLEYFPSIGPFDVCIWAMSARSDCRA